MLEKKLKGIEADWKGELLFAEHHQSHAASAFYASPFERAAVLTMDGVGEWLNKTLFRRRREVAQRTGSCCAK